MSKEDYTAFQYRKKKSEEKTAKEKKPSTKTAKSKPAAKKLKKVSKK